MKRSQTRKQKHTRKLNKTRKHKQDGKYEKETRKMNFIPIDVDVKHSELFDSGKTQYGMKC